MAYWDWDVSYEIGIAPIDKQHHRIVNYINELHSVLQTKDKARIESTMSAIAEYTVSHFAFEESLMKEANYEAFDAHKKIHEQFVSTVGKYQAAYREGYDITGQLMAELQIWLTHHILHDDKAYQASIKALYLKKAEADQKRLKAEQRKKSSWFWRLFGA